MKKFMLFLILILFQIVPAYSYQISFPGAKSLSIQSDGIFFAGSVNKNEDLFINGEKISPNASGAFSKSYKLNIGDNTFSIKSSEDKKAPEDLYTIKRLAIDNLSTNLVEFPPQSYKTTKDNVVLRSTPIDFGMNRMGYLPQGTDLIINGTKNEFSRVFLLIRSVSESLLPIPAFLLKLIHLLIRHALLSYFFFLRSSFFYLSTFKNFCKINLGVHHGRTKTFR